MDALLVSQSVPTFDKLILWSQEAVGVSIAKEADNLRLTGAAKYHSCLEALGANANKHLHFSVQMVGDDRDVLEAIQVAAMPFVYKDTVRRGIAYCLVSGTLDQWREAIIAGTARPNLRSLFNKIMSQFEAIGVNPWQDMTKQHDGNTFRLEHKK